MNSELESFIVGVLAKGFALLVIIAIMWGISFVDSTYRTHGLGAATLVAINFLGITWGLCTLLGMMDEE